MIKDLLNKIYLGKKEELVKEIEKKYKEKGFVIVNFIYFASLSKYLLENKENLENNDYYKSLINGDFLLPDGIALKIYLKKKHNKTVQENLNGTDFSPYFLNSLKGKNIHIAFYTVYDEKIGKSKEDAEKVEKYILEKFNPKGIFKAVSHYKKRGEDFDFDKYRQSLSNGQYEYKIFLVGLGTPFQEKWVEKNKKFFIENNVIVMNVGGLFDFWTNFEKRAPKIIRKLNLEWLWRLGQNPKKNWTKVKESFKLLKEIIK